MELSSFMLADGARLGGDGKFYIFGGQWDRIMAPAVPTTQLVAMALVFEVPYDEALADHQLEIFLRGEDGEPSGPRVSVQMAVGHAPRLEPGASTFVPLAVEAQLVVFERYARYEWVVQVDGETIGRRPITVTPAAPNGAAGPGPTAPPVPPQPPSSSWPQR